MTKISRLITASATALIFTVAVGFASPALADESSTDPGQLITVQTTSQIYYEPGQAAEGSLVAGQTWYVLGKDTTGKWIKVYVDQNSQVWVPASTFNLSGVTLAVVP